MFDFAEAFVDRIVEGCPATDADPPQGQGELLTVVRKVLRQGWPVRENHQEDIVVVVDGPDEALDGTGGRPDLPFHAAAGVENKAYADRKVVGLAEVGDRLILPVLLDDKIIC